jgi:glycerol uptake facilitator-like aquaporin
MPFTFSPDFKSRPFHTFLMMKLSLLLVVFVAQLVSLTQGATLYVVVQKSELLTTEAEAISTNTDSSMAGLNYPESVQTYKQMLYERALFMDAFFISAMLCFCYAIKRMK